MAKDPSFPTYASDWLGSNNRAMMSLEIQGAYWALLCRQWTDATCSLPDDNDVLARLSELGEGWFDGGSLLLRKCFPPHPDLEGRVANPRLLEVRAQRDEWREKSRQGGQKSGAARRAKSAAQKTSGKTKGGSRECEPNANQTRTKGQPNVNLPSPSSSPSLSPSSSLSSSLSSSPSPADYALSASADGGGKKPPKWAVEIDAVLGHYKTRRPRARPGKDARKLLTLRLVEGHTVSELCEAIDGNYASPHHCGQNARQTEYHDFGLIFQTSSDVERFRSYLETQGTPRLTDKNARTKANLQSYLNETEAPKDA